MKILSQGSERLSVVVINPQPTALGGAIKSAYAMIVVLVLLAFLMFPQTASLSESISIFNLSALLYALMPGLSWSMLISATYWVSTGQPMVEIFYMVIAYGMIFAMVTYLLYAIFPGATRDLSSAVNCMMMMTTIPFPIFWIIYHFELGYARKTFIFDRVLSKLIVEEKVFDKSVVQVFEQPLSWINAVDVNCQTTYHHSSRYGTTITDDYSIVIQGVSAGCLLTIKDRRRNGEKVVNRVAQRIRDFVRRDALSAM